MVVVESARSPMLACLLRLAPIEPGSGLRILELKTDKEGGASAAELAARAGGSVVSLSSATRGPVRPDQPVGIRVDWRFMPVGLLDWPPHLITVVRSDGSDSPPRSSGPAVPDSDADSYGFTCGCTRCVPPEPVAGVDRWVRLIDPAAAAHLVAVEYPNGRSRVAVAVWHRVQSGWYRTAVIIDGAWRARCCGRCHPR